ncbi:urease accessory protein, partial [Tremellales sp. Uapishka_1]
MQGGQCWESKAGGLSSEGAALSTLSPRAAPIIPQSPISNSPGTGHLHLTNPSRARFSSLLGTYPLKLLSPTPLPSQPSHLAIAYTLAYGGGLVAGDLISLRILVERGCGLILLTQGSTKVFKHRPGIRPLSHSIVRSPLAENQPSRQRMHVTLEPGSLVLILPDSISPFRNSRYSQTQRFVLPPCRTASVLILDWVNSGRADQRGETEKEIWAMDSYASTNEVVVGDRLIMRERMVLDNPIPAESTANPKDDQLSKVACRLAPYHIYSTILIHGPHFASLIRRLNDMTDRTTQFQLPRPPGLVWSFSPIEDTGGVLRVAGVEVESVRKWLRETLAAGGIADMVGEGLWPRLI